MAYISLRQNGLLMSIRPISSPFTHVHIFNTKRVSNEFVYFTYHGDHHDSTEFLLTLLSVYLKVVISSVSY